MATLKQRKATELLAENSGKPIGQAMREAGYSVISSETPKKLTDSKGFREVAEEVGLTDNFIIRALQEDIANKPGERIGELNLAAKIKNMITPVTQGNTTINNTQVNIGSLEDRKAMAEDFGEYLMEKTKQRARE